MWIAKDNDGAINLWVENPYKTIHGYWQTFGTDWHIPIIEHFETFELYQRFKDMNTDEPIEVDIMPMHDIGNLKLKGYE